MKSYSTFQFGGDRRAYLREKKRMGDLYKLRNTSQPPPPAAAQAVAAPGKVTVQWTPPSGSQAKNIVRYRIAMDTESNVIGETSSKDVKQFDAVVPNTAGHTFFIVGVSAAGTPSGRAAITRGQSL